MHSTTIRRRFTGAMALMALIVTVTAMAAFRQPAADAGGYGADYLVLNPALE